MTAGLLGREWRLPTSMRSCRCAWLAQSYRGLLLGTALVLTGCQLWSPLHTPVPPIDNASFMKMWTTYQHCRMSDDAGEILTDVEKLKYLARAVQVRERSAFLLSTPIRPFLSPLPSRLAVDPDAMLRTCALHGSEVARKAGQPDAEQELLMAATAEQS
jgi:hypothetical protein